MGKTNARRPPLIWIQSERADIFRCVVAEVVGTALLVIFTCGNCQLQGGFNLQDKLLPIALTFGFTVSALVATLGHVSGCHVNPVVTVGLLANGQINAVRAVIYIGAQLLGGVLGAAVLYGLLPNPGNLCGTSLNGINAFQGIIVEVIICFMLVFVICNSCESNPPNAPLLIGLAVVIGHLFGIPLTGASMNTARTFGPALVTMEFKDHYVYWIGPLLGGLLGGLFHRFIFFNKTLYDKAQSSVNGADQSNDTTPI